MGYIYLWAPGAELQIFLDFAGITVGGAGGLQCINVETHFDNPAQQSGLVDNSGVVLHFGPLGQPRPVEMGSFAVGDPTVSLYGQSLPSAWSQFDFDCPAGHLDDVPEITLVTLGHHMHVAGKMMRTVLTRPDRPAVTWTSEYFDASFQNGLDANVTVSGGQRPSFQTSCIYDNSPSQQHPMSTPSGRWGTGSSDEMCISFIWYYPRVHGLGDCPLEPGAGTLSGVTQLSNGAADLIRVFGSPTTENRPTAAPTE